MTPTILIPTLLCKRKDLCRRRKLKTELRPLQMVIKKDSTPSRRYQQRVRMRAVKLQDYVLEDFSKFLVPHLAKYQKEKKGDLDRDANA